MLFVILFVGTCIRAMLEAKGKSWAIMLKSYCTKIHSPTLSFRGIIVHFQIFIQDSGKKRRGQGIIWSKSHWSRQWISSSKKDRPKQGKKLKIYLNSRDVRWDSYTSSTYTIWSMYRLGEEPMVTCTKQKERMGELIDLYGFQNSSGRAMNWYDNLCYVIFHPTFFPFQWHKRVCSEADWRHWSLHVRLQVECKASKKWPLEV